MGDFADSFHLEKMRSGNPTVYLLREQFENFSSTPQKLDSCEAIALCFYQLEQYDDAANWFETTGKLVLADPGPPPQVKAMAALRHYERALECYEITEDEEKFTECSTLIAKLSKACAPA